VQEAGVIINEPPTMAVGVERKPAVHDDKAAVETSTNPPNPNSFEEQYTLGKMIGSGTFSVVRDAIHKPTGQKYAIKCIKREGLSAEDIEALTTEVAILKQVGSLLSLCSPFFKDVNLFFVCRYEMCR
jgi:serine/threonine protein kinase